MSRFGPLVLALLLLPWAGACSSLAVGCNLMIAAVPVGAEWSSGEPLPKDAAILAQTADFDRTGTKVDVDQQGQPRYDLALGPDATARLFAFTNSHIGGFIAIAVDGSIVSVPLVREAIMDGKLAISTGPDDATALHRAVTCLQA